MYDFPAAFEVARHTGPRLPQTIGTITESRVTVNLLNLSVPDPLGLIWWD